MDKQDLMRILCADVNATPIIHLGKTENDNNYKFEDCRCTFYICNNTIVLYDRDTSVEVGIADIADFSIEPNDCGYCVHIIIMPQSGIVTHISVILHSMKEVTRCL